MPHVLKDETARRLQRLLYSTDGSIVYKPGTPQGPTVAPLNFQIVYIDESTAIDTSVTDPDLTKDYYNAHVVVYNARTEGFEEYGDVYAIDPEDTALAEGYAFGFCCGNQTIDETERPVFMIVAYLSSTTLTIPTCIRLETA